MKDNNILEKFFNQRCMEKGNIHQLLDGYMREIFLKINIMEKEFYIFPTILDIKVILNIHKLLEKGNCIIMMGKYTKDNGKIMKKMDQVL